MRRGPNAGPAGTEIDPVLEWLAFGIEIIQVPLVLLAYTDTYLMLAHPI